MFKQLIITAALFLSTQASAAIIQYEGEGYSQNNQLWAFTVSLDDQLDDPGSIHMINLGFNNGQNRFFWTGEIFAAGDGLELFSDGGGVTYTFPDNVGAVIWRATNNIITDAGLLGLFAITLQGGIFSEYAVLPPEDIIASDFFASVYNTADGTFEQHYGEITSWNRVPVVEPALLGLFGFGLFCLGMLRRNKEKYDV